MVATILMMFAASLLILGGWIIKDTNGKDIDSGGGGGALGGLLIILGLPLLLGPSSWLISRQASTKARWALTCGVLSVCSFMIGSFLSLAAIILGLTSLKEARLTGTKPKNQKPALVGLVLGVLGLLINLFIIIHRF